MAAKSTDIDMKHNYVTVTLCVSHIAAPFNVLKLVMTTMR